MADQSAIRIPQGQLPINLVDTVMNLYCSPGGSDTLGDGSITNPYFHPSRALEDLKRLFFTETGSAIIQCSSGTYNYEYPIVVDNQTKKKISIKGATGLSFKLQEVTSYKYDAHENIGNNGYGVGSLVDNRITVKLASTSDLSPPPTTPVSPSVNNIAVGDYILFRDETSKSSQYYPTGKDGSLGSEGLTGPNPGDARTNVLGCYEIIAVDNTDNTVTFRSRGKNFLHKIGKSKITNDGDIFVEDDIYVGGYRSFNGSETGDPTGKYGTLQTTGIDTTGNLVSDHAISARIMKSIFKWNRPNNSGSGSATKGLVLKANSSLHTLSDLVFQGDVRFKHFNEMDPAASNGEAILAFKNSSIGNGVCQNIGISGWYAGVAAHTNSSINLEGICISDCSFGIVAENNSTITSNNGVITGCDVVGVVANGNSIIKTTNTTVGSAGYSPLAIDLDNIGSDAAGLESGDYLTLSVDDVVVTTKCVWNSFRNSYNRMIDPVFDLYNYYPMNTGNQIYLKSMWPIAPALGSRDESTNEISPNRIITSGGFVYGVGQGVLPENSSTSNYTPDGTCNDEPNRDLTGGVCLPPGFFGDPFDFPSTGAAATDDDPLACNCGTCQACLNGGCGDVCFDFCCTCHEYKCDSTNGCNPPICDCTDCNGGGNPCGGVGEPPCPPDCDGDDRCTDSLCEPPIDDPGRCAWCTACNSDAADCFCACNSNDICCTAPSTCGCEGEDECCNVDCSDPDNCSSSTCCCDKTDSLGRPCFCTNSSCSSGSPCAGLPGVFRECTDCEDGECPCPLDTDNPFSCTRPCNDEEPPDETTYRLIDHPMGIGFLAYNNSSIDAPRCYVSLLRNGGFVAIENSSIDANISFVRGCAGPGFLSSDNSSINARNSSAQRTRGGYTARQNSNIQAQMSYARDNAEYNFIARNDSIINCQNATSAISRTMVNNNTTTTARITTANQIYAGMSEAHGQSNLGSFINKTGIVEIETGDVTPNGADKWAVDASSNIEPTNAD
jgi:hypothetical protein